MGTVCGQVRPFGDQEGIDSPAYPRPWSRRLHPCGCTCLNERRFQQSAAHRAARQPATGALTTLTPVSCWSSAAGSLTSAARGGLDGLATRTLRLRLGPGARLHLSRRQSAATVGEPTDLARVCLAAPPPASAARSGYPSGQTRYDQPVTTTRGPSSHSPDYQATIPLRLRMATVSTKTLITTVSRSICTEPLTPGAHDMSRDKREHGLPPLR